MSKFYPLAIILVLACFESTAQTKRIAHRSHSGKLANLSFEGMDDFGLSYPYKERRDSIRKRQIAQPPKKDTVRRTPPAMNNLYVKKATVKSIRNKTK